MVFPLLGSAGLVEPGAKVHQAEVDLSRGGDVGPVAALVEPLVGEREILPDRSVAGILDRRRGGADVGHGVAVEVARPDPDASEVGPLAAHASCFPAR
jgi:hypothetical protein